MRRLRYLAGCAAAAAALLATGCSSGQATPGTAAATQSSSPSPAPEPGAVATAMMNAFSQATSVRLTGTVTQAGQSYRIDFMLTRSGDLAGSFTQGATSLQLLSTGGKTYIKVSKDFLALSRLPSAACARLCGKYVRTPSSVSRKMIGHMGWSALMAPIAAGFRPLVKVLQTRNAPAVLFKAATTGGEPAWLITGSGHTRLYIAAQGPPYLLRAVAPGSDVSFSEWNSVTIPPPPAASQLVTPAQLAGA